MDARDQMPPSLLEVEGGSEASQGAQGCEADKQTLG